MRRRVGPVIVFLIVAAMLLGTGVASARPAQARVDSVAPAGHSGSECHLHQAALDPADV